MSRTKRKFQGKEFRDGKFPILDIEYCGCPWCIAMGAKKRKLKDKIMNREMKRELKGIDELIG